MFSGVIKSRCRSGRTLKRKFTGVGPKVSNPRR
jgi:hypothetical protein